MEAPEFFFYLFIILEKSEFSFVKIYTRVNNHKYYYYYYTDMFQSY